MRRQRQGDALLSRTRDGLLVLRAGETRGIVAVDEVVPLLWFGHLAELWNVRADPPAVCGAAHQDRQGKLLFLVLHERGETPLQVFETQVANARQMASTIRTRPIACHARGCPA